MLVLITRVDRWMRSTFARSARAERTRAYFGSLAILCARRETLGLALFRGMMLRCAACINSGSACANAFSAASRSPFLIASSTVRTAPRIWVRRDLLMMVRRAILRVAFLAEVVLAMFSNSFGGDRSWVLGLESGGRSTT